MLDDFCWIIEVNGACALREGPANTLIRIIIVDSRGLFNCLPSETQVPLVVLYYSYHLDCLLFKCVNFKSYFKPISSLFRLQHPFRYTLIILMTSRFFKFGPANAKLSKFYELFIELCSLSSALAKFAPLF